MACVQNLDKLLMPTDMQDSGYVIKEQAVQRYRYGQTEHRANQIAFKANAGHGQGIVKGGSGLQQQPEKKGAPHRVFV